MKNLLKLVFVTLIFISNPLLAANITWNSTTTNVGVNDVFTLDVIGTGFASNVDGGGVNFSYNASVLNVTSVSINGSVWDLGFNDTGTIDNLLGSVDGIMVNAWSAVTGNFTVASVTFQAVGSGISGLSLSEFALNPWASGGSLLNPDYINASVVVSASPVPVPAAIWLFGSGLIGLAGFAKRKTA